MNFRFWKKTTVSENQGEEPGDKTIIADESDPKPVKSGWFTRLKSVLKPSRKKKETEEGAPERHANHPDEHAPEHHPKDSGGHGHTDRKHSAEEAEETTKPGFLARLKSTLLPSRKKKETEEEGIPGRHAQHTDKHTPAHAKKTGGRDDQNLGEEASEQPPVKHGKAKWIALALLILLIGGGFAAREWLLPQPDQKAPHTIAIKKEQPAKAPEPKSTDAAALTEAAEKAQTEATTLAENAAKAQADETAKTEAVAQAKAAEQAKAEAATAAAEHAKAEAEAAAQAKAAASSPESADAGIQTQIEALRKQNQAMQTQIEALKNQQPSVARPTGSATNSPRGEVLIINGKNTKESAQGLKKIIEEMNTASGIKGGQKPSK